MPISHAQEDLARASSSRPTHAALLAKVADEFGRLEDAPPRARRIVERSAFLINTAHQQHIDTRRKGVDDQDTQVGNDALTLAGLAQGVRDALDRGEITAAEARGKLRDHFALHRSMVDVGAVIDQEDERLAANAEQEPAAWQAAALRTGLLRPEFLPSVIELEESS